MLAPSSRNTIFSGWEWLRTWSPWLFAGCCVFCEISGIIHDDRQLGSLAWVWQEQKFLRTPGSYGFCQPRIPVLAVIAIADCTSCLLQNGVYQFQVVWVWILARFPSTFHWCCPSTQKCKSLKKSQETIKALFLHKLDHVPAKVSFLGFLSFSGSWQRISGSNR